MFVYYSKDDPTMAGVVYVGVEDTQREIESTTDANLTNVIIEMPWNSAYANKYGPFYMPVFARATVGDRVMWENHDFIPHTATAADGSFDSEVVSPGSSFYFIAKDKGTIPYFCEIHPWMQGILRIS